MQVSAPLILGFLCVLPTKRGLWSVPGYMSMYVYLLHPVALFNPGLMYLVFTGLSRLYGREVNVWSPATDGTAVLLLIPIALVVCGLLSTRCARSVFWPLVEPPTDRLLFASAPAPGGGGRGQPSLFAVRSEVNLAPV